jgi:hypothetical protein
MQPIDTFAVRAGITEVRSGGQPTSANLRHMQTRFVKPNTTPILPSG